MKVYMDLNANEIVSEDVARSRISASVDSDDIMSYIYHHVSWDELREHLVHDDFIDNIIDDISDSWFGDRFEEYDLIESESE